MIGNCIRNVANTTWGPTTASIFSEPPASAPVAAFDFAYGFQKSRRHVQNVVLSRGLSGLSIIATVSGDVSLDTLTDLQGSHTNRATQSGGLGLDCESPEP